MFQVQNISGDAKQKQTLVLPDGTTISFTISYVPLQLGWFILNLTYRGFVLNGLRITNSPNMLYQFRNQIPFGLACFSPSQREPYLQEDFVSGASLLYVLTEEEVNEYAEYLSGQV